MFVSLVAYGNCATAQEISSAEFWNLKVALIGFANLAFLCCVLVAGLGAVGVEGREIEETGWYGQWSVLVFLTSLLGLVYSLVFLLWAHVRTATMPKEEEEGSKYQNFLSRFRTNGGETGETA